VLHIHHRAIYPDERLDGRQFVNADGGESPALLGQDYPLNTRHQSGQAQVQSCSTSTRFCFPTSARDCAWLVLPRSTRRSSSSISLALPAAASRSSHVRPRRQILPKVVTRLRTFRSQPVGDSWACEPPPTLASSSLGLGCRPPIQCGPLSGQLHYRCEPSPANRGRADSSLCGDSDAATHRRQLWLDTCYSHH
jgi:hypothetical protein